MGASFFQPQELQESSAIKRLWRQMKYFDYEKAGVESINESDVMRELTKILRPTFGFAGAAGEVLLDFGYYANIIKISDELGIAIATDGVGTKIMIAEMMDRYDTVGIDCIAMNANDIVCVGAKPLAMVDYVAVERSTPKLLTGLAKGLHDGAKQAGISIPGGEIAQLREMIRGTREDSGFDLVGTCIGTVPLDRVIKGDRLEAGDVVIGIDSSGIHSNGMTLARRVLFDDGKFTVESHVDALGKTVGEELLTPTLIYVKPIVQILESDIDVKTLIHVTGDGFLNLLRVHSDVGFVIDNLPEVPPVFKLIQDAGDVSDEEMFRVYNMGVGFCVVVPEGDADRAMQYVGEAGFAARRIGHVDPSLGRVVRIPARNLRGEDGAFRRE